MGHSVESVWGYTPRQIIAYQALAERRTRHESANEIALLALGSRGDPAELKRKVRELTRD